MILYFGNILSSTGNNPSFIELLVPKLQTFYPVVSASHQKNKVLRLLHMIGVLIRNQSKTKMVLIDTYSYQGFYFAWIIGTLSRVLNKPYIPIIRGGDFINRIAKSAGITSSFLRNAAHVVAPSQYMYEALRKKGVDVIFIPNFIEVSEYVFKARTKLLPRMLWVRSFHKIYNPELAIDVVAQLKSKYPSVHLTMIGPDKDGSLDRCRQLAKNKVLETNITFTGKLSKPEIRSLAFEHDIFMNTTTIDNHPVSVIEAMALGLVVITTDVGGIPFLVTHEQEGVLVPSHDAPAFVKAIESVLNNADRAHQFQTQARTKVEQYDWSIVKTHWINLLNPYFAG